MTESTNQKLIKAILGFGVVIWIAIVVAIYYIVHKPAMLQNAGQFFGTILDVVLTVLMVSLAGGIGQRIVGKRNVIGPLEMLAVTVAIGLGILETVILLVGFLGFLYWWVAWVILILGLIVFFKDILAWFSNWNAFFPPEQKSGLSKISIGFVIFACLLSLFPALAPPLKWDSLVYHVELPRQYLANAQIGFLADNVFSGFPQLVEAFFTWALALRVITTATTLGWAVGLVALIGIEGLTRRLVGPKVAWLAPAVLLSGSHIARSMSWGYVDLWVMLFGLVMVVALDVYLRERSKFWLFLAGICIGLAMSSKYTAGILLPIGLFTLFQDWVGAWKKPRYRHLQTFLLDCMILVLIAFLVFSPWLIKNSLLTGNPISPFYFPGKSMDETRLVWRSGDSPGRSLLDDLLLPLHVTISIEGGTIEGVPDYDASIGPLLLALIPGLVVGLEAFEEQHRKRLKQFIFVALALWLGWGLAAHLGGDLVRARHYFGVFPILAVLAAAGFYAVSQVKFSQIRLGRLVLVLVVLTFILTGMDLFGDFVDHNPLPVITGLQSESEYLTDELGWFNLVMESVNDLPPESKVLFLWEPRGFYCQRECQADVILDNWWYLRQRFDTSESIAEFLRAEGVTHVLKYDFVAEFEKESHHLFLPEDWVEQENFREKQLELIESFDDYYDLYSLSTKNQ